MTKQAGTSGAAHINMIAAGTVFEGKLKTTGDVRISGRVVGELHVEGKVIITPEGAVEGNVVAANADIAGSMRGEISAAERLLLRNTARVDGNVTAGRLIVEEGAVFGGKCQMEGIGATTHEAARPPKQTPPKNGTTATLKNGTSATPGHESTGAEVATK